MNASIGKCRWEFFCFREEQRSSGRGKPADCSMFAVCADQRGSRVHERGQREQKCDGQPNYRDACRQVSGISFLPFLLHPLFHR